MQVINNISEKVKLSIYELKQGTTYICTNSIIRSDINKVILGVQQHSAHGIFLNDGQLVSSLFTSSGYLNSLEFIEVKSVLTIE